MAISLSSIASFQVLMRLPPECTNEECSEDARSLVCPLLQKSVSAFLEAASGLALLVEEMHAQHIGTPSPPLHTHPNLCQRGIFVATNANGRCKLCLE